MQPGRASDSPSRPTRRRNRVGARAQAVAFLSRAGMRLRPLAGHRSAALGGADAMEEMAMTVMTYGKTLRLAIGWKPRSRTARA